MQLRVLLEPSEDGGYTSVPSLPGCVSEGHTRDDSLASIREAIEPCLEPVDDDIAGRDNAELVEIDV